MLTIEQKYRLYEKAVQGPSFEVDFFNEAYRKLFKKSPRVLREDFCGTGYLSCSWVKHHPLNRAIGIDLDPVPVMYGTKNHLAELTPGQKKRMNFVLTDVMKASSYKADLVAAFNFSYCFFKDRDMLLTYFKTVKKSLKKDGIFFLDLFGGTDCGKKITDRVNHRNFVYYWECDYFNPIDHECRFKIHFKPKNQKKVERDVFVYDWRLWTLPEIRDLLKDAGFGQVLVYWEGDGKNGRGDGNFQVHNKADNCESWICYIGAIP